MDDDKHNISFTGVVITYNEERYLRECLNSLAFCEQLLVIDMGSDDSSVRIAKECGAEVIHHDRVLIVEQIREKVIAYVKNNWVIFVDPDEILPHDIEDDLRSVIANNPNTGLIKIPWQFYFKESPLHCTIWGRECEKSFVYHRKRVKFNPDVHATPQVLNGYTAVELPKKYDGYCVKHYWVYSYCKMFEKHWRYIRYEGKSRYNNGNRFCWSSAFINTMKVLKINLIEYRGLYNGFTGIFLSFFYSWYIFMCWLSLRKYERLQHFKESIVNNKK